VGQPHENTVIVTISPERVTGDWLAQARPQS
jgi:hypothetical protein